MIQECEVPEGIEVIYSDDFIAMINKPSGLLSVPGRGPDKRDCAVHRLQEQLPTARIVHRLDCATSGLMVLALNAEVHRELSRQFHDREVEKRYEALVYGFIQDENGRVDQPLMTDWPNRPRQMISEEGKPAQTDYHCISRNDKQTRILLTPITGRSHQLRVHMLHLGHPILGDGLYAHEQALNAAPRLCLHATFLSFTHPASNERLAFECSAPF